MEEATRNKKIPEKYREVILEVLSQYPELKDTHIHFRLRKKHPVPYGTAPAITGIFNSPKKRVYHLSILEEAKPPVEAVLFKNLTKAAQKGVLAHEFIHVIQFQECSRMKLLGVILRYPSQAFQRKIECDADRGAVEYGFGKELYTHASYIRTVPGYVEERKAVNKNYLKPDEILAYMEKLEHAPKKRKKPRL